MTQHYAADDGSVIDFTPSETGWRPVSAREAKDIKRDKAKRFLLGILQPGSTVYCVLTNCSSSGMSRRIKLLASYVDDSGKPRVLNISGWAGDATGLKVNRDELSIIMGGCGQDMGFAAVYSLGYALWPDGTPKPHGTRNGEPDIDGGYALKHSWI